jgi:hypothetical protein
MASYTLFFHPFTPPRPNLPNPTPLPPRKTLFFDFFASKTDFNTFFLPKTTLTFLD